MTTTIPLDIVEEVLDELTGAWKELTLHSCALVSHAFRPLAQKRIFSRCVLVTCEPRYLGLHRILSLRPELALYVRDLSITLRRNTLAPHTLSHLIRMFTNMRKLHVEAGWAPGPGQVDGWKGHSPEVRAALLDLFCLPVLEDLTIVKVMDFPFSTFKRVHSLQRLRLLDVCPDLADVNDQPNVTRPTMDARLHSLRVQFGYFPQSGVKLLRTLIMPSLLPGIQCLVSFCIGPLATREEVELCNKILEGAHKTLQNVTVAVLDKYHNYAATYFPPPLDLRSLVHLSALTIESSSKASLILPWVCYSLKSIPCVNDVKEITLRLDASDIVHHHSKSSWSAIELVIMNWTSPSLRAVSFLGEIPPDLSMFFKEQLPNLEGRGILFDVRA